MDFLNLSGAGTQCTQCLLLSLLWRTKKTKKRKEKENNYRIGINFQPKKMYTTFV